MAVAGTLSGQSAKGRTLVRIDPRYLRPPEVDPLLGDASKARARLGWRPQVGFEWPRSGGSWRTPRIPRTETHVIDAAYRAGVKRLLGSSCLYPRDCPQPMKQESLLSGPAGADQPTLCHRQVAGIELCWAYNRQHETHYLAVMPANLYGPVDHYDLERIRAERSRNRKVLGDDHSRDSLWTALTQQPVGGAIRASLCALAYRRLPFDPVASKLGARIEGNRPLVFQVPMTLPCSVYSEKPA